MPEAHRLIAIPQGMGWGHGGPFVAREPFQIIKEPSGAYRSTFSLRHAPSLIGLGAGATKRFIAPGGSDSNSGLSAELPKATLDNAFLTTLPYEFELAPGTYLNAWTTAPVKDRAYIYCRNGKARLVIGQIPPTWSPIGSGIYSAPIGTTYVITAVNDRQRDEFGFPLALPRYSNLTSLQSSGAHGYAHVGSTLYIRLRDDGAGFPVPGNGEIIVPQRSSSLTAGPRFNFGSRYLVENLEIWGGDLGMMLNGVPGSFGAMFAAFVNCDFAFSYTNGVSMYNAVGGAYFKQCRAYLNRSDGFNGHDEGASYRCVWIEDHCTALANGFNATTNNNQGSTNHEHGISIRIGGFYGYGRGQAIADVGDSRNFILGSTLMGSRSSSDRTGLHTTGTAVNVVQDSFVQGQTYSLRASDGSIIRSVGNSLEGDVLQDDNGQVIEE